MCSQPTGMWDVCAMLSGTADGEEDPGTLPEGVPPVPVFPSTEDFALEQSNDNTLQFTFDQVIKIKDQLVT